VFDLSVISEMNDLRVKYGSGLLRGAVNFGLNSISYLLNMQPFRGPLYVGWDMHHKCNARCDYCDRWLIGRHEKNLVTTKEALKIVNDMGDLGVWTLSLGGGEPLLRPDMDVIIKAARRRGMQVNMSTNGALLKQNAKKVIDSGVSSISVSVESHIAKDHDKVRGFPGLFAKLSEGIEEVKRLRKGSFPHLKVRMCVGKDSYDRVEDYIKYWAPKVDQVLLQPIHESPTNAFRVPDAYKLSDKDRKKFEDEFRRLRKRYKMLDTIYYREFPLFFFDKKKHKRKYKCYASYFSLNIEPDLSVYSCAALIGKLGNLRQNTFKDIWKGQAARKFRKLVRERKNQCTCWYSCSGTINCYLNKTIGKVEIEPRNVR